MFYMAQLQTRLRSNELPKGEAWSETKKKKKTTQLRERLTSLLADDHPQTLERMRGR